MIFCEVMIRYEDEGDWKWFDTIVGPFRVRELAQQLAETEAQHMRLGQYRAMFFRLLVFDGSKCVKSYEFFTSVYSQTVEDINFQEVEVPSEEELKKHSAVTFTSSGLGERKF